jgi:TonB family protein
MGLLRERRWRLAVELSILVHLLFAWLAPQGHQLVATLMAAPIPKVAPAVTEDPPIRFELVDLPNQKEEKPSRQSAPASDLSRRAHGGEGEPSDRPGIRGTTYDLRMAPGQQTSQVPPPQAQQRPRQERQQRNRESTSQQPEDASSATVLAAPATSEPQRAVPLLKGLSPLSPPAPGEGVMPDRTGGQADLGPLSFDTQWYDWGPYAAEMLRRIRYHWNIPEIARIGVQGVTRIHFYIGKDGTVSGLQIMRESDHPPMDFAARDAIMNASPLPPLPADLGHDREGVSITFYYNIKPPEDGGGR